jgi:hypothetical protein
MKLCPKIILEGARLTHKTDVAFALNEHPRFVGPRKYRYHSPLISAEWCGFTPYPWGRGLINFQPDEEPIAMETYRTWARLFQLIRYYSWVVDRFHISTKAYQRTYRGAECDFGWLEEILDELGFRLVLCTRAPESFARARAERIKISGNPMQYDDLGALIAEQEVMVQLTGESRLTSLRLDVSDGDVAKATDSIVTWLEETGGLYHV